MQPDYRPPWMDGDAQQIDISIDRVDLMNLLAADARILDLASQRLARQIKLFEGADNELGVKLQYESALDEAVVTVEREMIDAAGDPENKLPAGLKSRSFKAMDAEARQRLLDQEADLCRRHFEMEAEIRALEKWIRAKERSSSLRQSILKAQTQTAGMGE